MLIGKYQEAEILFNTMKADMCGMYRGRIGGEALANVPDWVVKLAREYEVTQYFKNERDREYITYSLYETSCNGVKLMYIDCGFNGAYVRWR